MALLSLITSANQYASNAKRKTVAVQDIFKALQSNQFEMLVEPLQEALKGLNRVQEKSLLEGEFLLPLDYQEQIRKKKEGNAKKTEATVENDEEEEEEEEENIEPTDE